MGWQKTFSLARRNKGCHLVTDEVVAQIEPGLRGVQVSLVVIFSLLSRSSSLGCRTEVVQRGQA